MPRSNNFLDLGPSYLRSHVSYAWQDPSPVDRGMVKRSMLEETQRRYAPGAGEQRLRGQSNGSGRILNPSAKGRVGSADSHGYIASALVSGTSDGPVPRLGEALYGRTMRVQSASPTVIAHTSGVGNSVFRGCKRSVIDPQISQRPQTACIPAVERHLRRYTRCMSAGNAGQQRSPDVFSCAERPAGRFASLSAAGELVARPGTPVVGTQVPRVVSQGIIGAWGRQVGSTAPDTIERRPGRSKSTEPSLLGKDAGRLNNATEIVDSLTAAVKPGSRTKIKAAVDCWWDEQHLGASSSHRNTSSPSSTAGTVRRGSLQRSHSAGQRKSSTVSNRGKHSGDRARGPSTRSTRPRTSSLTSQGRKSVIESNGSVSSSNSQDKSSSFTEREDTGSSAGTQGQSGGSRSSASNSLMLISKLALPDTVAGYLGLGKYSLSPGLETSQSAPKDSALDQQPSPRGANLAPGYLAASSTSAKVSQENQDSQDKREQEGEEAQNVPQAVGKVGKPHGSCSSDKVAVQTQEIRALQDITSQMSTALGITHEWIADFCEELIDEWESDTECGDVSDA